MQQESLLNKILNELNLDSYIPVLHKYGVD